MVEYRNGFIGDVEDMQSVMEEAIHKGGRDSYTDEQIDALTQSYRELFTALSLNVGSELVVATDEDDVVGFGGMTFEYNNIDALFVHPEYMGRGIGSEILEQLEEAAREHGLNGLTVFASRNATGFYAKNGFERIREEMIQTPDSREVPSVLMIKEFNENADLPHPEIEDKFSD